MEEEISSGGRRFQRRSSCSALPSTTIIALNDVNDRPCKLGPLGSFLRFNDSFSESVGSVSDSSDCARSGDGSDVDRWGGVHDELNVEKVEKPTMVEFPANEFGSFVAHDDSIKKEMKWGKLRKDSSLENTSRQRMPRRSSWSGSLFSADPNNTCTPPLTVGNDHEYSRMSLGKPHERILSPVTSLQDDGVVSSFKVSSCDGVLVENHASLGRRIIVASEESDHQSREPRTRKSRANRRSSWSGGVGIENPTSEPNDLSTPNDFEAADVHDHTSRIDDMSSVRNSKNIDEMNAKDVKRTLLMVKHVCSGGAKARRRASWTASSLDCLDGAPDDKQVPKPHLESPLSLATEVLSLVKKRMESAGDQDKMEATCSIEDKPHNRFPTIPSVINSSYSLADDTTLPRRFSSHRMERRSSWHASTAAQPEMSESSHGSERSQTFVLDLSVPNNTWKCQEEACGVTGLHMNTCLVTGANERHHHQDVSYRTWLGKNRNPSPAHESGSPRILVVSSANMPCNDWQEECTDMSNACLQLTAFGDVTSIACGQ